MLGHSHPGTHCMVQIGKGWSQVAVQAEPHSFHTLPLVQVVGGVAVIVKSVAMAKRRSRRNIVVVENVTAVGQPRIDLLLYEYNCCWTARIDLLLLEKNTLFHSLFDR